MRTFHMIVLILCALAAAAMGANAMSNAQSAIHEIEGLICLVALTVAAGAGYIASAIDGKK